MTPEQILDEIEILFPEAQCELIHENAWQLAIAVVLSAQSTDASVNKVTPALFEHYPEPVNLALASLEDVEEHLKSLGLYRNKAKSIVGLSEKLVSDFDGKMPSDYESLQSLPGIGRKSANVIRSVIFDIPSLAVDTHVERVSKRLGLAGLQDSVLQTEKSLMEKLPRERWNRAHHDLIFFGRYFCKAKKPECDHCPFVAFCHKEELELLKASKKKEKKHV